MTDDKPASDASLEVAATMLSPDSDRAALMAAETRTVAGGSGRAVAPARLRSREASTAAAHSGARRPLPTSISVPARLRTMR